MSKSGVAPYVSPSELQETLAVLKGVHTHRNRAVLYFSHFLGLRAKELAALKIEDVYDIRKKEVKEVVRLLGAYTKGNKFREVFLVHEKTESYVLTYIQKCRDNALPNEPLFKSQKADNERNGAFSARTMQRMIGNIYKKAGINASSHSGRRAFATHLIRNNADIYSVQQLMGHSSITTTQKYFTSDPNRLKDQVKKLNFDD